MGHYTKLHICGIVSFHQLLRYNRHGRQVDAHARTHVCAHTHTRTHARTHAHAHTRARTHTHTHTHLASHCKEEVVLFWQTRVTMTAKGGVFLNSSLLPLGETKDGAKEMGKKRTKCTHTKAFQQKRREWGGGGGGGKWQKKNQIRPTPVSFEVEAGWERGVEWWGGDGRVCVR